MHGPLKHMLKSIVAFVTLTVALSIAWDIVFPGRIYFCTDEVGLDYWQPGSWVHGEVEFVDDVVAASSRNMSESDVMVRGWTIESVWVIWSVMFVSSILVARLLARIRWLRLSFVPRNQSASDVLREFSIRLPSPDDLP